MIIYRHRWNDLNFVGFIMRFVPCDEDPNDFFDTAIDGGGSMHGQNGMAYMPRKKMGENML